MVYVAAHVGFAGAILNPFTIGIAQGLSDLPLFSGFEYRVFCWAILNVIMITWVLRYAAKVKKNPKASLVYNLDSHWRQEKVDNTQEIEYKSDTSFYSYRTCTFFLLFSPYNVIHRGTLQLNHICCPGINHTICPNRIFFFTQIFSLLYLNNSRFHYSFPNCRSNGLRMVSA